jgi:hypothetical protein
MTLLSNTTFFLKVVVLAKDADVKNATTDINKISFFIFRD